MVVAAGADAEDELDTASCDREIIWGVSRAYADRARPAEAVGL